MKQPWVSVMGCFLRWLGFLPLHPALLPVQLSRPPEAWGSRKGHLVCSRPLPTEAHLPEALTSHTFASAGRLPHAALTIWTNRFKKNYQYHLPTTNKMWQFCQKKKKNRKRNGNGRVSVFIFQDLENLGTGMEKHLGTGLCFSKEVQIAGFGLTCLVDNMLFYTWVFEVI